MVATHDAQVIPVTPMKHLWVVTSGRRAACWPTLFLTVFSCVRLGLSRPEELSPFWLLFANSEEKKEKNNEGNSPENPVS